MSNVENDKNIRDAVVISAAASVMAVGVVLVEDYRSLISVPRAPYVDWDQEREKFINSILLPSDDHCIGIIRFSPYAFSQLCNTMSQRNLLQPTKHMSVREQLIIFLHILGQNMRFRVVGSCFHRSTEIIHRYFLMVLDAVLKFYPHVICQTNSTPPEIRDNERYYPWFADCIGAVDGTHVSASVPIEDQTRFHGRKGITQNVLAAANPNHEDYLNKKIEMYEELALVVGKDRARGDCVKSFLDVDLEANPDVESIPLDNEINVEDESNATEVPNASNSSTSSLPTTSQARQHRKRNRKNFDAEKQMKNMAEKIGAIAEALGRMSDNQLNVQKLYDEVMKMKGYEEVFLGMAFDYLVNHEMTARSFMVKNERLRKIWLDSFEKMVNDGELI